MDRTFAHDECTAFVRLSREAAATRTRSLRLLRASPYQRNYGRIVRMLDKTASVTLHIEIQNKFSRRSELPSTSSAKSWHRQSQSRRNRHAWRALRSWHAGTGRHTDMVAGSASCLKRSESLKSTGLKIAVPSASGSGRGEEQACSALAPTPSAFRRSRSH